MWGRRIHEDADGAGPGGATLTRVAGAEAGGDDVQVELVERPGEEAWITISGGHD